MEKTFRPPNSLRFPFNVKPFIYKPFLYDLMILILPIQPFSFCFLLLCCDLFVSDLSCEMCVAPLSQGLAMIFFVICGLQKSLVSIILAFLSGCF